jgi:hypothetical protein
MTDTKSGQHRGLGDECLVPGYRVALQSQAPSTGSKGVCSTDGCGVQLHLALPIFVLSKSVRTVPLNDRLHPASLVVLLSETGTRLLLHFW